jgi:hypothetical protein
MKTLSGASAGAWRRLHDPLVVDLRPPAGVNMVDEGGGVKPHGPAAWPERLLESLSAGKISPR